MKTLLLLFAASLTAHAETYIVENPAVRTVAGRTYAITDHAWETIGGFCIGTNSDGLILIEQTHREATGEVTLDAQGKTIARAAREVTDQLRVRNFSGTPKPGQWVHCLAVRVGDVWDCGKPALATVEASSRRVTNYVAPKLFMNFNR